MYGKQRHVAPLPGRAAVACLFQELLDEAARVHTCLRGAGAADEVDLEALLEGRAPVLEGVEAVLQQRGAPDRDPVSCWVRQANHACSGAVPVRNS